MISLTDLPGPGSWKPSGKNERVEAERELSSQGNKGRAGCQASVHSWILSLCEVHGLETQSAYWERVCISKAVFENTGSYNGDTFQCP